MCWGDAGYRSGTETGPNGLFCHPATGVRSEPMTRERTIAALERLVNLGGSMTTRALQAHPETSGLSVTQYRLFVHVASSDGIRVGELARRIGGRSQTTSRLIQRLESRGLVSSARGELDRREVIVRATPRGADLWADIGVRRRAQIRGALAGLTLADDAVDAIELLAERFARAVD